MINFKNGRSTVNSGYMQKETTLRMMMTRRPKVFDQRAAPDQQVMDSSGNKTATAE
jgi:hypothetical protein